VTGGWGGDLAAEGAGEKFFDNLVLSGSGFGAREAVLSVAVRSSHGMGTAGGGSDAAAGRAHLLCGNDSGQATKGTRWMFWRREATKDVAWLR
jgi:hypothetical protein